MRKFLPQSRLTIAIVCCTIALVTAQWVSNKSPRSSTLSISNTVLSESESNLDRKASRQTSRPKLGQLKQASLPDLEKLAALAKRNPKPNIDNNPIETSPLAKFVSTTESEQPIEEFIASDSLNNPTMNLPYGLAEGSGITTEAATLEVLPSNAPATIEDRIEPLPSSEPNPGTSLKPESNANTSRTRLNTQLASTTQPAKEPTSSQPPTKEPGPFFPSAIKPAQDSNSLNPSNFRLAEQPKIGDTFHPHHPETDKRSWLVEPEIHDFHPGPIYDGLPYDPYGLMNVYEGKTLYATQRPLLELGRPWYHLGQLSEGYTFLGKHNPVNPQLIVFGDFRTAYGQSNLVDDSNSQVAFEWNMNWDFRLTSTERFAWFLAPMNDGESNTRFELDNDRYFDQWNADFLFGYFEGDLGAIVGGFTGQTLPFDLPFAMGVMPLLFQNGVWLEDQFLGVAATIPARNSPRLNISNMDVTFFAGFDEIISPAFEFNDDAAKLYGMASFIEAWNGYWEIDYAYLEDRTFNDRSYHNIGIGYSRRYGRWISNSSRIIVNAGQEAANGVNTADGFLLISENSLITAHPSTIIPYFNFFAGFDRPQKAAGFNILRNTGILFESDGMTGYPTLDDTAQNTFGGAIGLNMMPNDFSQQLILETAYVGKHKNGNRNVAGDQIGLGVRYQLPLNNSIILRADAMVGFLENSDNINGARLELRRKF